MNGAMTMEQTAEPVLNDSTKKKKDAGGKNEGTQELCSQVSTVFGELSRVQDEVRTRLEEFGAREAEIIRLRQEIEEERDKLDAESVRVERLGRKIAAREETLRKREEAIEHREEALQAFQRMLVLMAAALEDPTPSNLAKAFETAQQALQTGHTAAKPAVTADGEHAESPTEDDVDAASAAADGDGAELDLSDLNPEEVRRLEMLSQLGTASKREIAKQIRAEREADSKGGSTKNKKGAKRRWLF